MLVFALELDEENDVWHMSYQARGFLVVSKSRRTPQGAIESIDSKVDSGQSI